jgi:hypothetical protein
MSVTTAPETRKMCQNVTSAAWSMVSLSSGLSVRRDCLS